MGKTVGVCFLMISVFAVSSLNAGCTASTPGRQSASTGTALKAINDKIQDGTITVEGDTDNAPRP